MKLGTTTWRNRNTEKIKELHSFAKNEGITSPSISIIGPGGIVKRFSDVSPTGSKEALSKKQKIAKLIIHQFESLIRKTNKFTLKSFETEEIINELADLNPVLFKIYDIHEKVLRTILLDGYPMEIRRIIMDVCKEKFSETSDIVFAYNIIQRTEDPLKTFENIISHVKENGLLSLDIGKHLKINYENLPLKKISNNLFQKQSQSTLLEQ